MQIRAELLALHLLENLCGEVWPPGAAVGENAGVQEGFGRRRKGESGAEEVAVEFVVRVLGGNLGVENGFGVIEFVVGNEGGEEREESGEGKGSEGGERGRGVCPIEEGEEGGGVAVEGGGGENGVDDVGG